MQSAAAEGGMASIEMAKINEISGWRKRVAEMAAARSEIRWLQHGEDGGRQRLANRRKREISASKARRSEKAKSGGVISGEMAYRQLAGGGAKKDAAAK
jgi:hypothetical protein